VTSDFIQSWELFYASYLAGWCIAVLLSIVGVSVVARDQVFVGAAVSQASMLGIAVWMIAASWFSGEQAGHQAHHAHDHDDMISAMPAVSAVVFAIGAAILTGYSRRIGRESYEAVTGWVFLFSSSFALVLLAKSPFGKAEIEHLLASTIIGATEVDVWLFIGLTVTTVAVLVGNYRTIMMTVLDPESAAVLGVRVRLWELLIAAWLGLVTGLALRASGLLFTFGCLVLPALIARGTCRRPSSMFLVAPLIALATSVLSFVIANAEGVDLPPAQLAIGIQASLLPIVWVWRSLLAS